MEQTQSTQSEAELRQLVAEVAAAYFANSHVSPGEIPSVINQIAMSLGGVGVAAPVSEPEPGPAKATNAQVRKSITPEALISFEDNKPYKTLRRHLATRGLTPESYREKWGLPSDYPMVAPTYSAARSELAKSLGLGQRGQAARRKAQAARRSGGRARTAKSPA
jgi:predicted transcriptional regulator